MTSPASGVTQVPVTVNGITNQYSAEYTTSNVQTEFQNALNAIIAVGNVATSGGSLTDQDLTSFNTALNQLKQMALGTDPATGGNLSSSITSSMAEAVNTILSLTNAVNPNISVTNATGFDTLQQLTTWSDLYYGGIQATLAAFVPIASASSSSLQSYIQLEYITSGNQMLYSQMSQLNTSMNVTNQALVVLGQVQQLFDKAVIPAPTNYTNINWAQQSGSIHTITANGAAQFYENSTHNSLGQPLLISVSPGFASQLQTQGLALMAQLKASISALNEVNPVGATDPNSLQSLLQTIVNDMNAGDQYGSSSMVAWALDNSNYVSGSNPSMAGTYQNDVNDAIATAQNLNSGQTTNLQTLLFQFQEFYSSSSSMLRTINNMINDMNTKTNGN